jgi:hypothetical protein
MIVRACLSFLALNLFFFAVTGSAGAQTPGCSDYTAYLRWVAREMPPPGPFAPQVNAVRVKGNLAYVAAGSAGLAIYDVTDPSQPALLGTADTPYFAMDVAVYGTHAYVADWHSPGFCVVDVTDPSAPAVIGSDGNTPSPNYWKVAVANHDTVYVTDHYNGVRVVDVTDPAAPDVVGLIPIGGYVWDLAVVGDYLYVVDDINGLHIFDKSLTTFDPEYLGTCPLPATSAGLDVVGNFAYVACTDAGLQVISLFDRENPTVVGMLDYPDEFTRFTAVSVFDDMAVVATTGSAEAKDGLFLVDVSEPKDPRIVNSLGLYFQTPYDVFSTGSHAYLSAKGKGFLVADLTNPASPPFVSSYVEEEYLPRAVAAAGDHAFVLDSLHGLRVMDLTTAPAATLVGHVDLPGGAHEIVLQDDLAYVAGGSGGLRIIDVATPGAPFSRGTLTPLGAQLGVAVQGDYAYLASDTYGMHVVDVSDPDLPVERGTVDPSYYSVAAVDVAGTHAYVTCGFGGLYSIDVSDPDLPVVADHVTFDGDAANVHVAGNLAFVSGYEDGVFLVDVTDPTAMSLVSTLVTPGYVLDVALVGDLAYIADNEGGLQIADYSDPANPRYLGCADTPNQTALDLAVAGQRVCVADWEGGFHVLPAHCVPSATPGGPPPVLRALTARPNPFNPRTTIGFSLAAPEVVRITVYSLDGRPVRRLAAREYPAGPHGVTWDGRDDGGRDLPSGAYLVDLVTPSMNRQGRVTLLK